MLHNARHPPQRMVRLLRVELEGAANKAAVQEVGRHVEARRPLGRGPLRVQAVYSAPCNVILHVINGHEQEGTAPGEARSLLLPLLLLDTDDVCGMQGYQNALICRMGQPQ